MRRWDDRWQTARDLSHELKWVGEAGSQADAPAVAGRSRGTARIAWAVAAVLLAVYVRDGAVVTQRFDEKKLTTVGDPVALLDRVAFNPINSSALFGVSQAGVMVYYPATPGGSFTLAWYDRDGKRSDSLDSGNFLGSMALSPDGTQVAVSLLNSDGMSSDLWDLDLTRGTKIRLTSGPGMKRNPVWQPDGQLLFSAGFTGGSIRIDRIKSDGTGTSETVLKSDDFVDALRQFVAKAIICLLPDPRTFRAAQPLKGQQLAYSPLLETGQREVYVTHFPDATRRYRVSTQGGTLPRWRGDGKMLFYGTRNNIVAVSVDEKPDSIWLGTPLTMSAGAGTLSSSFRDAGDCARIAFISKSTIHSPNSADTRFSKFLGSGRITGYPETIP